VLLHARNTLKYFARIGTARQCGEGMSVRRYLVPKNAVAVGN
jgi:hypothetical protein